MANGGSLPCHASLEESVGEDLQCHVLIAVCWAQAIFLSFLWHFQYLLWGQGGFCTLFHLGGCTDQQLLCGYSSCREGKVFVMSSRPLPDPFPRTPPPLLNTLSLCQRILYYYICSEICILNFNFWNGSYYIIIDSESTNLAHLVFVGFWLVEISKEKDSETILAQDLLQVCTALISTSDFQLTPNWGGLSTFTPCWNGMGTLLHLPPSPLKWLSI